MANTFRVGINLSPHILRSPPPKYRHLALTFCPIVLQVGGLDFPHLIWTDFAGVLLRLWTQEVRQLANEESRAARLVFFDTPNEVWIRPTTTRWWKVSCISREGKQKVVKGEAALIP